MEINRQFQDRHSDGESADWVQKQQIERDICLMYHQLANYSHVMGDLYWGSVFTLPYWEFLSFAGVDPQERAFIRDGCLVAILAMAWDQIDGSGAYIEPHVSSCRDAIERLAPTDEETLRLIQTVRLALEVAERREPETLELAALSSWVHDHYVRGYFRRITREFDSNPYFQT